MENHMMHMRCIHNRLLRHVTCFAIVMLATAIGQYMHACDCDSRGDFVTVAKAERLVALVKIVQHLTFKEVHSESMPMSMEVEVVEIYRGEETRKRFKVWGDPGNLCRPYLHQFPEGQHFLIAFSPARDGSQAPGLHDERSEDYTISNCGQYWLSVDLPKRIVSYRLYQATWEAPLSTIEAELRERR